MPTPQPPTPPLHLVASNGSCLLLEQKMPWHYNALMLELKNTTLMIPTLMLLHHNDTNTLADATTCITICNMTNNV